MSDLYIPDSNPQNLHIFYSPKFNSKHLNDRYKE